MRSRNNSKGFTLVEVLISVVILSTGFVIVAQSLGRTQDALRISQNLVQASQIMEERLSEVEIDLRKSKKLSPSSASGDEKFPGGRVFRWAKDVLPYVREDITDETRLNQLDIRVDWKDGAARQNREKLSSIILNRDLKKEAL